MLIYAFVDFFPIPSFFSHCFGDAHHGRVNKCGAPHDFCKLRPIRTYTIQMDLQIVVCSTANSNIYAAHIIGMQNGLGVRLRVDEPPSVGNVRAIL